MNKKIYSKLILTFIIVVINLSFGNVHSKELTGKEIMEKAEHNKTEKEFIAGEMVIIENNKIKEKREVKVWLQNLDELGNYSLLRFYSPSRIVGIGLLSRKVKGQTQEQWIYIPSQKRSRRISPDKRNENFMGTQFNYEDLGANSIDDYEYNFVREETINSRVFYLVESYPKQKDSSYSKTVNWVRKDINVIEKIGFYNLKNELSKVEYLSDVRNIDNKWKAYCIKLVNLKTKAETIFNIKERKSNCNFKSNQFSVEQLPE